MDTQKERAVKTLRMPATFRAAACLDAAGERWALVADNGGASRLIEFDARSNQTERSLLLPDLYVRVASNFRDNLLVLIGRDKVSVRTFDRLEEVLKDPLSEKIPGDAAYGWSPSGRYLAFGFKQLLIYDLQQKKRIADLASTGWIKGVGWISDEGLSVMDDRGRLYWTSNLLKGWELRQEPPAESVYRAFWFSAILRWLAVSDSGRALSWDYVTPSVLLDLPVSALELWSVAPDPRGSRVAVSGKDSRIYIVDLGQKKVVRTLEGHTDGVPFVRYDSANRLISAGDDSTLRVWDPDTGKLLQTVQAHRSLINAFAISPDGRWLISVSSDRAIKLWALPGLRWAQDLGLTKDAGADVSFLPGDNQPFLVSDWGGGLYLYQGTAPDWTMKQEFQTGKQIIYMLCPAAHGWWANFQFGEKDGLWLVPAEDINQATHISPDSGYYCWTSKDGQLTAAVSSNHIEVRANAAGKINASYYVANDLGDPVAIQNQPPMVLIGRSNGHLMAWPLNSK